MIADVISILRVRALEKGIGLEHRWDGPVPERIVTDPSRFRQLMMNLIGNAVKFTDKGAVTLVARLENGSDSPNLAVDIIDTGIGIAPEYLSRIFEPFSQADQSIMRRFGGTGLGLAISRQIAELLGGCISVVSRPGEGSTFTARIATGPLESVRLLEAPMADLMPSQPAKAGAYLSVLSNVSVLLVEDGETNRKLVSLILRRAGASVVIAENGQVALDTVRLQPFDAILMDMQMPILDGYEATRILRRRGVNTPIIALTAHSMKGDEERCLEAGCSGYITKPIDSDRLLQTLANVMGTCVSAAAETVEPTGEDHGVIYSACRPTTRLIAKSLTNLSLSCGLRSPISSNSPAKNALPTWPARPIGSRAPRVRPALAALTRPAAELEQAAKGGQSQDVDVWLGRIEKIVARIQSSRTARNGDCVSLRRKWAGV